MLRIVRTAALPLVVTLFLFGACFPNASGAEPAARPPLPRIPSVAPADVEATFRVRHGFRMELLAAEPLVADPVAIDYDERGRAYVAEMSDYPHTNKAADKPFSESSGQESTGKLRLLEDVDGDGRFDRATVFASGLSWPTGVVCWKGGVYVAATPDLWYFRDTDGDGRADERRKVFTGFRKFNVQAVMNNLRWGPDNKIYGAGSSNGGDIRHADRPDDPPIPLGRHDFRFDPRTERLELISGGARFGAAFDDDGERFLCNIRNPVQHVVLPRDALARNPHLSVRSAVHDAAASGDTLPIFRISPVEPWRKVRAERWAAEAGQSYPRSETSAGAYFTSSSGVTVYRGGAYPPEFLGDVFVGEVAANAVHRQRLERDGPTFKASRVDAGVEFVASTDNWFRPVNFINAPDGTLHLLDMYRETIEHPWSIPDDLLAELDLQSGADRGRIYRLAPPGFRSPPPPRLDAASIDDLVRALESPHGWWRDTAQRLLVERVDEASLPPLRRLLRAGRSDPARYHALLALEGLDSLDDDDLAAALNDRSPGVRRQAIRAAAARLSYSSRLLEPVASRAGDEDVRVRFQTALTLGDITDPVADAALVRIARSDAADPWMRAALLSAVASRAASTLAEFWRFDRIEGADRAAPLARDLAQTIAGAGPPAAVATTLDLAARPPAFVREAAAGSLWQREVVIGLALGLRRSGRNLAEFHGPPDSPAARIVASTFNDARRLVALDDAPLSARLQSVELLAHDDYARAAPHLYPLLDARRPAELQQAAVRALGSYSDPDVARRLVELYRSLTPALQSEALEVLVARPDRAPALVDAVERRLIGPLQLSPARRTQLLRHADPEIRRRAEMALAGSAPGPRRDVLARYQAALRLPGDRERGRAVYVRECQTCHRLDGQGYEVGPNLETVRNRSPDELLVNILDPHREVSPNYLEYAAELADGRVLSGVVAAETATGLTLRRAQGVEETVLRRDVERLVATGKSLMPEGLEAKLDLQQTADLLFYLKGR